MYNYSHLAVLLLDLYMFVLFGVALDKRSITSHY